jgi:ribosomal protein S18 acetylase RimI-like enzyme
MAAATSATVRLATLADLSSIVSVHEAAFDGFFLTELGPSFLRQLYRGFIAENGGICCVVETVLPDGSTNLSGFVAGALWPKEFFRHLLYRRGLYFALAAIPALCRRPGRFLPRLFFALKYRGEAPPVAQQGALLSSLGVRPGVTRAGFGSILVDAFCSSAASKGANQVYLTTDSDDNVAVNRFYLKAGFKCVRTQVLRGRRMNTYLREVD